MQSPAHVEGAMIIEYVNPDIQVSLFTVVKLPCDYRRLCDNVHNVILTLPRIVRKVYVIVTTFTIKQKQL